MKTTRIVLIGCSKDKYPTNGRLKTPEELYGGQLFKKRVEYAKRIQSDPNVPNRTGYVWGVLSAKYGLWWPNHQQRTYDLKLADLCPIARAEWALRVAWSLLGAFEDQGTNYRGTVVELHAGRLYCEQLGGVLESLGFVVEKPCEGMGIGEQLREYTSGRLSWRAMEREPETFSDLPLFAKEVAA